MSFDNLLIETLSSGLPGDYNGDGTVDAADYTLWRDGLTADPTEAGYNLWRDNYSATLAVPSAATSVPEPTSVLVQAGLLGIAYAAGRRRPQVEPTRR